MYTDLFFELIRISLGQQLHFSHTPTNEEWSEMFKLAQQQSLVGICFSGVEQLPMGQRPQKLLLLNWYAVSQQIEELNKIINQRTVELCEHLHNDRYNACVLKGQAIALYYTNPLRRQSGDIDVWVRTPCGSMEDDRIQLIQYVRSQYPDAEICFHHADYDIYKDVEVELHFMPMRLYNKIADRKLQAWLEEEKDKQFRNVIDTSEGQMTVATDEFNAVFLMLHIAKHILEEGIGLRQLMDYYFLLSTTENVIDHEKFVMLFKTFGMYKIVHAVMYVLQTIFGLPSEKLLCPTNERQGRFLVNEIMLSGNFGHYDPRFGEHRNETSLHKFIRKQTRVIRFFTLSQSETLWSPLFSIYQRMWRRIRGLI